MRFPPHRQHFFNYAHLLVDILEMWLEVAFPRRVNKEAGHIASVLSGSTGSGGVVFAPHHQQVGHVGYNKVECPALTEMEPA